MDSPAPPLQSWRGLALGAGLLGVVAVADYFMGAEIGSDTLYLIPVVCAAWCAGFVEALALAAASAACWLLVDTKLLSHVYSNPAAPWCNGLIASALFATSAYLVSRLKEALAREHELSRLKSDLLSLASHELGNSVTIMSSGLGFLRKELGDHDGSKTGRLLEAMEKAQVSLKEALTYFLNFARVDSGKFSLELDAVDLRKLVEEYVEWAQPLILQSGLDVRLEFPGPPLVRADRRALSLIVSNLIHNAIKYTLPMGHITISVKTAGNKVELCVADEGIGIPPEDVEAVVSGFALTGDKKETPRGSRLGLKLSRQLIESHGSRLKIDSEPGRGSRFSFQLDPA